MGGVTGAGKEWSTLKVEPSASVGVVSARVAALYADAEADFEHYEVIKDVVDECIDLALNYRQSGHPGGSRSKVHLLLAALLSRTGGTFDEVVDEAHLSSGHILDAIERFVAEHDGRLVRLEDVLAALRLQGESPTTTAHENQRTPVVGTGWEVQHE